MKHTNEEYLAKKSVAEEARTAWVQAENADTRLANVIAAKKAALDEAVADYNSLVRDDAYEALFSDPEGPLVAACKQYRFSGLMSVDYKRDSQSQHIKTSDLHISTDNDKPNLREVFHLRDIEAKRTALVDAGAKLPEVMHNPAWSTKVEKMCRVFNTAIKISDNIGKPIGPTADMIFYDAKGKSIDVADMTAEQRDKISDDYSIGKGLKPCLQEVVDAVIFDVGNRTDEQNKYRAKEADARFVRDHAREFKAKTHQSGEMSEAKAFELAFCVIAHILTGEAYDELTTGK